MTATDPIVWAEGGRPVLRVLDLFCKAGGAGAGYAQAGFEVTGVDIKPQPRCPYAVIQADVFDLTPDYLAQFDAFHASPPCQGYTELRHAPNSRPHPQLIGKTRALLQATGKPYVIENVRGAYLAMRNPITLCGSHFGLSTHGFQLQRHRLFECSFPVRQPVCAHRQPTIGVYGGHVRCRSTKFWREGGADFPGFDKKALAMEAMGIWWPMTMDELSEAIPPAFTRYIGAALLAALDPRSPISPVMPGSSASREFSTANRAGLEGEY